MPKLLVTLKADCTVGYAEKLCIEFAPPRPPNDLWQAGGEDSAKIKQIQLCYKPCLPDKFIGKAQVLAEGCVSMERRNREVTLQVDPSHCR